ncbi:MAG: hypothetical protein R3E77_11190 [Steroidobacteraceae bacterium]
MYFALIPISLLVTAAIVWSMGIHGSFQFDDFGVIVADPRVQSLTAWWESMPGIRPVLKLTYALNHEYGSDATGFRTVNVVLHAINTVLVYGVTLLLGQQIAQRPDNIRTASAPVAAGIAAMLFALHPVQADAVTYISGRSTSLAALFSLLTIALWAASRRDAALAPTARSNRVMHLAAYVTLALALGCKEVSVATVPAMGLWVLCTGSQDRLLSSRVLRDLTHSVGPYALVVLLALVAAIWVTPYPRLLAQAAVGHTLSGNLWTQANGVSYLIGQLLLVRLPNPDAGLAQVVQPGAATMLRAMMLLVLIGLGLSQLRRRPAVAFGMLWFFIWLAPTNSVLSRMDVAFDRQLYLAMIGPAWLLGWKLSSIQKRCGRVGAVVPVVMLAILLGQRSLAQQSIYENEITFWEHVLRQTPGNARAANNLGMAYAAACRETDALRAFARAQSLDPGDFRPRINAQLLALRQLPGVPARCADVRVSATM